jgi:hypothetical protein
MHVDRSSPYMDAEKGSKIERRPRTCGNPTRGTPLDSRVRGNDHLMVSEKCDRLSPWKSLEGAGGGCSSLLPASWSGGAARRLLFHLGGLTPFSR